MDNDAEIHTRVWEASEDRRTQIFIAHLQVIVEFASQAIKSIILANSAGAGAVLAFLATMWQSPGVEQVAGPALRCVTIFAAGVFAAIVCATVSYLAQYCYSQSESREGRSAWWYWGIGFHLVALAAGIIGALSFAFGALEGIDALEAARGGLGPKPTSLELYSAPLPPVLPEAFSY